MKRWIAIMLSIAMLLSMAGLAEEQEAEEGLAAEQEITIDSEEAEIFGDEIQLEMEDLSLSIDDTELLLENENDEITELPEDLLQTNAPEDFEINANGELTKYKGPGGDVVIPYGVKSIGYEAFYNCDSLTSVVIPNSVTTIGSASFSTCLKLKNVVIPSSVNRIEYGAFGSCGLTSLSIPDSVTFIGGSAFSNCDSLTSVVIPNSIERIEKGTFWACDNLKTVTIPNSVTYIGEKAFEFCEGLETIKIPDSVTEISYSAFSCCSSLTDVTISSRIKVLKDYVFSWCTNLKHITIPDGVQSIESYAFLYCDNLTSVTIPSSVTSISYLAFQHHNSNLTIYGEAGSYAETYAKESKIPFVAGSPAPQPAFPIIIGNNGGTQGTFNDSLEQYIMNMDSDKYYPDLAYMLMALAAAAYNDTGSQGGLLTVENAGYQSKSKELYHITKAYEDLGFVDYQPYNYYNDPDDAAYGVDNAAFTIGRKQLSENEALVLIVVRGSYGKIPDLAKGDPLTLTSDWKSNLRIDMDSSGKHYGFATAADKVYSQVMSFLKSRYQNTFIKSNIRYVITGHSRGAAVANLLAVRLHDAGVPDSKVYDYNFACPDTVRGFTLSDLSKDHENIVNVCNSADAVSVIPGVIGDGLDGIIAKFQSLFVSWGKYGKTYFYCKNWNSTKEFDLTRTFDKHNSPHDYKFYVADMSKKPGGFKTWAQIVKRRIKLGVADGISSIISTFYPSYGVTSIEKAKTTIEDQVYTGKALKPTVKVVLNKKTLKKGTDYTVAYSNNKKIGTATVTINGKGKYTGTKSVSFKILPNAVTGLKLTAGKRQMTVSWKKVSGVTGYQLQYYPKGNSASVKKVIISSSKTVKKTIKSLKKGRVYYVRIRSYKKVNGSNYYSAWSTKKKVTIK